MGDNVFAVEVHQVNSASTDVAFGMDLSASWVRTTLDDPLDGAVALLDGLRITELMYHAAEGDRLDYIELQNVGDVAIDLAGVRLSAGVDFVFPPIVLMPGQYVVVADEVADFASKYGQDVRVAGQYAGRLSNRGEEIVLTLPAPQKAAILRFGYEDTWHKTTDGGGHSLTIGDTTLSPGMWGDPASWLASPATPGAQ